MAGCNAENDPQSASTRGSASVASIRSRLDELLQVEFTNYALHEEAALIAAHGPAAQKFLLEWTERAAAVNLQLGHLFVTQAARVLTEATQRPLEAWVLQALDEMDRSGLKAALEVMRLPQRFVASGREAAGSGVVADMAGMLQHLVTGLSGRPLRIEPGTTVAPFTDTETLFLPAVVSRFDTVSDNRALTKAWVVMLWAQTRFGSFQIGWADICGRFEDADRARDCLGKLETLRLTATVTRVLPGIGREIQRLDSMTRTTPWPAPWSTWALRLGRPGSTVFDSVALLAEATACPVPVCMPVYACAWRPEAVEAVRAARLVRERELLRVQLARWLDSQASGPSKPDRPRRVSLRQPDAPEADGLSRPELLVDGQLHPVPPGIQGLLTSVQLDLGQIPPEYLEAAGPGEYRPDTSPAVERDPDSVWSGTYHEDGATFYPEWDYRRQHFRKHWCVMREIEVPAVHDGFREQVLRRHPGLSRQLRRSFEALRETSRVERRQIDGEEVDLDAWVESQADHDAGLDRSERLYAQRRRSDRDIAALFLVDMSGSTQGWINEVEREALLLLSEAMQALGDRYAIYGFSGMTRKRCELFRIKRFDEPYGAEVQGRISGIRPRDYTRMGFAVRHATHLLGQVDARRRLLVIISDGKPDDYSDKYRGTYGIEDTRRALQQAAQAGVHPFCVTVDKEAHEYLPRLYGTARYVVVPDLARLPQRVAEIYRRLTLSR